MKIWTIFLFLGLEACTSYHKKFQDPLTNHDRDHLKSSLLDRPHSLERPLPKKAPLLAKTSFVPLILRQKVTIQLNESKDVKEVFMELCKAAKINIILDKEIEGSVFYSAKSRPFIEIINSICEMTQLRFKYENDLLVIERDTPYLKTYDVQFLNLHRKTKNNVSITNNILSKSSPSGAGANGSTTEVSSQVDSDFWKELETILANLLQISKGHSFDESSEKIEEKKTLPLFGNGVNNTSQNIRTQEKKKIKINKRPSFSMHKQAGLVTIYGTQKNHRLIEDFLKRLKRKTSTQILIEAKVLEVTLKEQYKSGIDWQRIGQYGLGNYTGGSGNGFHGDLNVSALFGSIAQKTPTVITTPETSQVFHIGGSGQSLSAVLNFMETFGVVRTLSSPRLTVLNNQTALLKVAENFVFFNVTGERQFLNSGAAHYGSLVSANSSPQTIPIGFVMSVHPSIDPETNEVIINLRPTITRLIDTKQDPAVVLLNQSLRNPSDHIKSEFPVIAVREIDSILRIKSGAVAILGGLMIEGAETGKAGIPGTTDDGPLSFFTASKRRAKSITELVIFLKASILDSPTPDTKDRDLYENFTMDSRRFNMEKVT